VIATRPAARNWAAGLFSVKRDIPAPRQGVTAQHNFIEIDRKRYRWRDRSFWSDRLRERASVFISEIAAAPANVHHVHDPGS
jgi:hypothetical protein